MSVLKYSIFLVLILFTRKAVTEAEVGNCMCIYYGYGSVTCDTKQIKPSKMPDKCTSFLISSLMLDRDDSTSDSNVVTVNNFYSPLIDLAWKSNKPVYLVLLHSYDDNFSYDDPNIEKKAIQDAFAILDFRSNHTNMDGILVGDFLMDDYKDKQKMISGLHKYLKVLKNNLLGLSVGFGVNANDIIDLFLAKDPGFNFNEIEKKVDFFIIAYSIFNDCTPDLIKGGIVPLNGDKPYTLEKMKKACDNAKLFKKKLYFKYNIFAVSNNTSYLTQHNVCFSSSGRMCKNEKETSHWCAETSATLKAKGKFAYENANGMVIDTTDLNDTDEDCKCGSQFPSLNFLLDGWNGRDDHPACPLFDRPNTK